MRTAEYEAGSLLARPGTRINPLLTNSEPYQTILSDISARENIWQRTHCHGTATKTFSDVTSQYTVTLTYSTVQSPSWKANWFVASQEIPRISRNPKVHYRTHKRPPPVSTLGQPNPVHIPTSHLLEIHLNIIHPSTPRSPQWSLPLRFPHQDPIHPPLLTHTCHMSSPSLSYLFYHPHNIGWAPKTTRP